MSADEATSRQNPGDLTLEFSPVPGRGLEAEATHLAAEIESLTGGGPFGPAQ